MNSPIVILGGKGQVGKELTTLGWPEAIILARHDLDITDEEAVMTRIKELRPFAILNTAAYTYVDIAEKEPDAAFACNRDGVLYLARAAAATGAWLIHLSTDYVFDGLATRPYHENDPILPTGVYGSSKAAGEEAIRQTLDRYVILRTAWVFGIHGRNFVKTMLGLGKSKQVIGVIADQHGCPTPSAAIASTLRNITEHIINASLERKDTALAGIYHFAGSPAVTWHAFAKAVFTAAALYGYNSPELKKLTTADYPTPASRPTYSVMDCQKIKQTFGITQPNWESSLTEMMGLLIKGMTL